jgi:hypothetical protein
VFFVGIQVVKEALTHPTADLKEQWRHKGRVMKLFDLRSNGKDVFCTADLDKRRKHRGGVIGSGCG